MLRYNALIVDDHAIFRRGLKAVLRKSNYFNHIFEASDGAAAVNVVARESVDVILMDIEMKGMNGVEASQIIIARNPGIKVIAMTMFAEQGYISKMRSIGACGYLLKDEDPNEIYKALASVLNGGTFYTSKVQTILENPTGSALNSTRQEAITKAQEDVLRLLCEEYSNEQIASRLNLSINTIKRHRHDLLIRTGSVNLAGLVRFAIFRGIIGKV